MNDYMKNDGDACFYVVQTQLDNGNYSYGFYQDSLADINPEAYGFKREDSYC